MSRREYEEWRDAHTWDPSRGTGLVIETDLAPTAWIEPLLLGQWSADLAMLPGGFKAYARLFFPYAGEEETHHHERIAAALTEPEASLLSGQTARQSRRPTAVSCRRANSVRCCPS
jgi:hypothetical protein